MKLITKSGYAGTSVEQIAKAAKVSAGYLYRHYPSKAQLVQAIYEERMREFHNAMFESIKRNDTVREILSDIIDYLDELVKTNCDVFNFLFVLLHDHSFSFPESRLEGVRKISRQIYRKGRATGEISADYSDEQVFYTFFSIPFKFFDSRLRKIFRDKSITRGDTKLLKRICLNALT